MNYFCTICKVQYFLNKNGLFDGLHGLPEQGLALHVVLSISDPMQLDPPCACGGSLQSLVLFCVPDSQLLLHSPYSVHSPHCPSTKIFSQVVVLVQMTSAET